MPAARREQRASNGEGGRSARREDGDRPEHACLEVPLDLADEVIGARLRWDQVHFDLSAGEDLHLARGGSLELTRGVLGLAEGDRPEEVLGRELVLDIAHVVQP